MDNCATLLAVVTIQLVILTRRRSYRGGFDDPPERPRVVEVYIWKRQHASAIYHPATSTSRRSTKMLPWKIAASLSASASESVET
jgi:hypothetical protein